MKSGGENLNEIRDERKINVENFQQHFWNSHEFDGKLYR